MPDTNIIGRTTLQMYSIEIGHGYSHMSQTHLAISALSSITNKTWDCAGVH